MTDRPEPVVQRVARLEHELAAVRALVARTYEAADGWPQRLEELRRRPEYEEAFIGAPLVSVRIGTYRGADTLCERALASVRRQTYPHWEAVVVGDGCEDDTGERIAALGDDRIHFSNRPRNGPYPEAPELRWLVAGTHSFNEAAARTRGRWIAPLDQDDEWDADHLSVLLGTAQRARAEVVYGRMRVEVEDGPETWFGEWPPRIGHFGFQGALYHADLKDFRYDVAAALVGEPGDWNLARRMWEAGVRFHFLPRAVGTYFVGRDARNIATWEQWAEERGALPRRPPVSVDPALSAELGRLLDRIPVDFGGGCSLYKAEILAGLVVEFDLRRAIDIGVYRGRSLCPLAAAFRSLGAGEVVGIDPFESGAAKQSDRHTIGSARLDEWAVTQDWEGIYRGVVDLLADAGLAPFARVVREPATTAARHFERASIDLVHIDGNHDARAVAADLRNYRPLVRPGGFIVLDDVSWESVRPVYDELSMSAMHFTEAHTEHDDFAVFRIDA
jgi:Methyltransferase domain/Glycosyl transferase family 2